MILTTLPQPCVGVRVGKTGGMERIRAQWVYWSRGLECIGAGQNSGGGGWYSGRIKSKLLRLVKGSSLLQNGEVGLVAGSEHYRPFGILSYFLRSLALRILLHIAS